MIMGIILASGFSRRMNKNKLILTIEGTPIVERVILAGLNSNLDQMLIVYRDSCVKEIADCYKIPAVYNENAISGQCESIKLGIKNSAQETKAYLFLMGDQPFITSEVINQLISAHKKYENTIIVPMYERKKGSPVLFPYVYKTNLLALEGDFGGRNMIMDANNLVHYETIQDKQVGLDIDTWNEYIQITSI